MTVPVTLTTNLQWLCNSQLLESDFVNRKNNKQLHTDIHGDAYKIHIVSISTQGC